MFRSSIPRSFTKLESKRRRVLWHTGGSPFVSVLAREVVKSMTGDFASRRMQPAILFSPCVASPRLRGAVYRACVHAHLFNPIQVERIPRWLAAFLSPGGPKHGADEGQANFHRTGFLALRNAYAGLVSHRHRAPQSLMTLRRGQSRFSNCYVLDRNQMKNPRTAASESICDVVLASGSVRGAIQRNYNS